MAKLAMPQENGLYGIQIIPVQSSCYDAKESMLANSETLQLISFLVLWLQKDLQK